MSVSISPSPSRHNLTSPPQSQNPISLRLYKVLGANFDDEATKEALHTLSDLYAPSPNAYTSVKGKEVKRGLEDNDQDDADDTDEAKAQPRPISNGITLSNEAVPGDIAARARKNLRRDVENKLAESSRRFLKAFGEVDKVSIDYTSYVAIYSEYISCTRV